MRARRIAAAESSAVVLARSLRAEIETEFAAADAALLGLATQLEADGVSPSGLAAARQQFTRQLQHQTGIHTFAVTDPAGTVLASSQPLAEGNSASGRGYFETFRTGSSPSLILGEAVRSRVDGRWIVTLSRPFRNAQGGLGGLAIASVSVGYLALQLQDAEGGGKGTVSLVREDGSLLARSPPAEQELGQPAGLPAAIASDTGTSGSRRVARPGTGRLGIEAFARAERYPFAIVVSLEPGEANTGWGWGAALRLGASIALAALIMLFGMRFLRQVRRRQAVERALARSEARFRLLTEHAGDTVAHIGPDGRIRYASPAAARLVGLPVHRVMDQPLMDFVHPDHRTALASTLRRMGSPGEPVSLTFLLLREDRREVWAEASMQRLAPGPDGKPMGFVAVARDVTARRRDGEKLAQLARTDGLTGLANRRSFDEMLDTEWRRAARDGHPLSLLLLDVDRFKRFNDHYGHVAGDDALRAVAAALNASIRRPADLAARYGGEEFAVILPDTDASGARDVAERIRLAVMDARIVHEMNEAGLVTASVGVASAHPRPGREQERMALVAAADEALYAAKGAGRNRVHASIVTTPDTLPRRA